MFGNFGKFTENNFIKKETPTRMFFCEFYEIFKNTFFTEYIETIAL